MASVVRRAPLTPSQVSTGSVVVIVSSNSSTVARNSDGSWPPRPPVVFVQWVEMDPVTPLPPPGILVGDVYEDYAGAP